ncbi:MAG: hypothetical protein R3270_11075 [Gammaproteobacteria bacterium]|nr:hypothetical protein [Gammaproteobacteria bacterium]
MENLHAQHHGGNAIALAVNEDNIVEDIRYFQRRLEALKNPDDGHDRAMHRVYSSLLAHRRQMLAAYRDGRPEAWFEYEQVAI